MARSLISKLSLASVILVYLTIALGALTRATGAGLGCGPDWPLCLGYIIPPMVLHEIEVFLEYIHRVVAFLAFTSILAVAILSLRLNPTRGSRSVILWAYTTLIITVIQVLVGAIIVKLHLNPAFSALHTMLATLVAITATITALEIRYHERR